MAETLIILFSAVLSGCLLLRAKRTALLLTAAAAMVSGGLAAAISGSSPVSLCLGLLVGTAAFAACEKREMVQTGWMLFFAGSVAGLCAAFLQMLTAASVSGVGFYTYGIFYSLHIPALLLTYPRIVLSARENGRRLNLLLLVMFAVVCLLTGICGALLHRVGDVLWLVLVLVLLTALFWAMTAAAVLLTAYREKDRQSGAENVFFDEMMTFMNVVRSQRHDYNLHVQTIAGLIDNRKWEDCRAYVQAISRDTAEMNAILPVCDPAVAALIYNYRLLAERQGITLLTDIRDDLGLVVTNAYETNKVIGNLLQNAIDELSEQGGASCIVLETFKRGDASLVRVSNQVTDPTRFLQSGEGIFRQGYTTKQSHDGVGLSSIRALLRSKGGDVTAWVEEDTVHFVAAIPRKHMESAGAERMGGAS